MRFLIGAAAVISSFAAHAVGPANPLVAPPPPIQVGKDKPSDAPASAKPNPPSPPPLDRLVAGQQASPGQAADPAHPTAVPLPPERWLASAQVTSIVGDKASLQVPTSLNQAQTTERAIDGGALGAFAPQAQATASSGQGAAAPSSDAGGGPRTARQYPRVEILFVKTGKPLFFRGERFEVLVEPDEVTIHRARKDGKSVVRDVIFIGSLSPTEYALAPVVGKYGTPDSSALRRTAPQFGGTYPAPAAAGTSTAGAGGAR